MSPQVGKICILQHRIFEFSVPKIWGKKIRTGRGFRQNQKESTVQGNFLRQLTCIPTALKEQSEGVLMRKASKMCWEASEIQMEAQLSKDMLNSVFRSAEWTCYLKAKQRTLMQSLANMQERQLRTSWISTKGQAHLRQVLSTGPDGRDGLQWRVPQGFMRK